MNEPPSTNDREPLEALLGRAARGDETAWRALVETYTPRVYALLRSQCGMPELAEEITQSTFVTIVARIGDYAEVGRFEQWLFRIAMNRLRDEMRRRKRQASPVGDDTLVGLAGAAPSPPPGREATDRAEDLAALREALARLNENDRQVIQLRHFAQMSFARIAHVLGEPLGTVLARHHRALKKLKHVLGPPADAEKQQKNPDLPSGETRQ